MNNNLDLNKLRFLLHKYYEAETSPEEENIIISIFSESDAEDIPEDLIADREIFLSMKEFLPCQSELEIPDDLFSKINREISDAPLAESKDSKTRWKRPFAYAVAAAVACIVLAFGIWHINTSRVLKSPTIANVAKHPAPSPEDSHSIDPEPIETKAIAETPVQKPSIDPPERRRHRIVKASVESTNEEDGYVEITDPEEAREIILEISNLLAINSRKTSEATRMVEAAIDEYKEITKQLL